MDHSTTLEKAVKQHYEQYVYPRFPLFTSVRRCDTYALNLDALWARFNSEALPQPPKIFLAGSGSFSPYPTAVANRNASITALDLAKANLNRAKLHTRLHLYFNLAFVEGSVLDAPTLLKGERFQFIDCYGVLHHIPDVVSALKALHTLLYPGAVIRIMVYSASARNATQAARTALRLLQIKRVKTIKALYKKSSKDSRLRACIESNYESQFDWGLADMLLHPYAKTYKIAELQGALASAQLEPIQFIHWGALPDVSVEIARLRQLEKNHQLATNFILLAGRIEDSSKRVAWQQQKETQDTFIQLNPVLRNTLPRLPLTRLQISPKLGFTNPVLDWRAKRLLSLFKQPVKKSSLEPIDRQRIQPYLDALFLMESSIPP